MPATMAGKPMTGQVMPPAGMMMPASNTGTPTLGSQPH
jgi:hypothetical protein